mgnify:CR=1 FL=1
MELSEFKANEGKQVNIQVGDRTFARHAIATHFVQVGESYMDLIQKYVVPIYQEGDILSSSEKIISLCQKRIVRKSDMKLSWLAKFLSKFASHSSAGIGVDSPWKMQFAIDQRGALYVIWAAICAGFGKLFGKRGVFYEMVGQEVAGLDGFYDHCFDVYGEFGIRIPENSDGVCEEVYRETGIRMMIVDANDPGTAGQVRRHPGKRGGPDGHDRGQPLRQWHPAHPHGPHPGGQGLTTSS